VMILVLWSVRLHLSFYFYFCSCVPSSCPHSKFKFFFFFPQGMTCLLQVPAPGTYVRAKVKKIVEVGNSAECMYEVCALEYGRTVVVERERLRRYRNDVKIYFDAFPPLAISCCLRGGARLIESGGPCSVRDWTPEEMHQITEFCPFAKV
jgi:Tudor domain